MQLLKALQFFHSRQQSYHCISSDSVLVWNLNPLVIKLAHDGITHRTQDCEVRGRAGEGGAALEGCVNSLQLCAYLAAVPADDPIRLAYRVRHPHAHITSFVSMKPAIDTLALPV